MSYKEPLKPGIKISPFWIRSITAALAKQYNIKIERGEKWAMDMKERKLIYTDMLQYLDKDNVLAILLHEIGHIKYTSYPWIDESTAVFKEAPEAERFCMNAIEDTRVDYIVSRDYENSMNLLDALHWQSASEGISKLSEYNDKMKIYIQEMKAFAPMLADAEKEIKAGKITQQEYEAWLQDNNPENKIQRINPVLEIMFLMLTMYHGFHDEPIIKNYYRPELVAKAKLCLQAQYDHFPEGMDNTREVQAYYEDIIWPIIKEMSEKDKDGKEKQFHSGSHAGKGNQQVDAQGKPVPNEPGDAGEMPATLQRIKERLDAIKEKIEATIKKTGRLPGKEPPPPHDEVDYNKYYEQIKDMVNTSSYKFNRVLRDNKFDRFVGRFKSGKLNMRRLYKYKASDYKMFQKKQERQNKDYAFSIILDCSSSMNGSPIEESMKGIVLMSEVLHKCKVPFEVCFFSAGAKPVYGKRFNENLSRLKMSQEATKVWGGGTQIWEAFKPSADSLSARPERHKIMITLTDGSVDGSDSENMRKLMRKNPTISYYGMGIGVDLKDIFDNSVEIENVSELVPKFAAILKKHIKIG